MPIQPLYLFLAQVNYPNDFGSRPYFSPCPLIILVILGGGDVSGVVWQALAFTFRYKSLSSFE